MEYTLIQVTVLLSQLLSLAANPIIRLPTGQIRGRNARTIANKNFFAFEGIPYAAAPIGNLRFEAPQPAPSWDGVRDATQINVTCYQIGIKAATESEDCLVINVYTPRLPSKHGRVALPVMIFIHGGSFIFGSSLEYGPDLFVNNDVILVTFNYRLGIFGIVSTEDTVIPGNNALKDQQLAIRWVHDNIRFFGGDPQRVTIFGQSSGAASVGYQLLNQNNNGLFQSAILQSGSVLSPWAMQRDARKVAFKTVSFLNPIFNSSTDSRALLKFIKTADAQALNNASLQYYVTEYGSSNQEYAEGFYYEPVIEVKNPTAFITKKMYGLLKSGRVLRVPIMTGITAEENLAFHTDSNQLKATLQKYDQNLDWLVPIDMPISDKTKRVKMGEKIRQLYTNGQPLADHLGDGIRYFSDNSFTRSVIKYAELTSKVAETYFYVFSYDGAIGGFNVTYEGADKVTHTEDIRYLFCSGDGCNDDKYSEADRITRQRLIKLWTDFAKYRNPVPRRSKLLQNITWPLVNTDCGDFLYLDIGENLQIKNHPKERTYKKWNEFYNSLNYTDFDTY